VTDEITLTLPADDEFHRIAHLVIGGLAVRLDLTFETLEDLNLALENLLERRPLDGDLVVSVRVDGSDLLARVGPFTTDLRGQLEREPADGVGLRRVLETVTDRFEVAESNGAQWVELHKTVDRVKVNG